MAAREYWKENFVYNEGDEIQVRFRGRQGRFTEVCKISRLLINVQAGKETVYGIMVKFAGEQEEKSISHHQIVGSEQLEMF
jgi:hypothetical protein